MLRVITAVVLLALHPLGSAQNAPSQRVNLNSPDALENVRVANPAHYEKIQRIVGGLMQRPSGETARWIQASFGATEVLYTDLLLTSVPPQKDIAFTLDSTRYSGRITLGGAQAYFVPTRATEK